MLEDTAVRSHSGERKSKAATVIPRPIVVSTVAGIVDTREIDPQLTRRMRHHRTITWVSACVTMTIPWIDTVEVEIDAAGLNIQRRDQDTPPPEVTATSA